MRGRRSTMPHGERFAGTGMIEVRRLPGSRVKPAIGPSAACTSVQAMRFVQDAFDALLASDAVLANLVSGMHARGLSAVVFGGWARDRLVEHLLHRDCPSRDIDFVAHGGVPVAEVFPAYAPRN